MMKTSARRLLPAPLRHWISRLLGFGMRYRGPFANWQEAKRHSSGYDDELILARVLAGTRLVVAGKAAYEQDSVVFAKPDPNLQMCVAIALSAARSRRPLAILDFGGALGSHFFRCQDLLQQLDLDSWNVVEQDHFVSCGRRELTSIEKLRFYPTIEDACKAAPPGLLIASSVLQYIEDPMHTLNVLVDCGADVLLLDRMPFSDDGKTHCMVQQVPKDIYPASYPIWFLSWQDTCRALSGKYAMLMEFDSGDAPASAGKIRAQYRGALFVRRHGAT
jgi:putative methyltransferase (TIGR04325 family)